MSKKELENKTYFNSPKGESFHDSQTESDSANTNQKSFQKETANNINNLIISEKDKKDETQENSDNIDYDKKFWNININELQISDLNLKREHSSDPKSSVDTPDISKQHLKEYLNEDLLNALDVSPMVTPKNIPKDAANENINEINNNENIIPITDDMMNGTNNDLFQFSLYNNNSGNSKNEKELNSNKNENSNISIKNNPIDELIKISENSENNNEKNRKIQKEEEDFNDNGIMESFTPPNLNLNNDSPIDIKPNDFNNVINYDEKNINITKNININNNDEFKNLKEDEGGGNKNDNNINNLKDSPKKNILNTDINVNNSQNENISKSNNINKFSQILEKKTDFSDKRKNTNNKAYISSQMQHPFMPHMSHFPYATQQHIIQPLQTNIHENKFDGNKKFNLIIPIQALKKNPKMKKPFEIREGDWTCSDCGNLNFAFRVKCNRCGILKETSEQKKSSTPNNEHLEGNTNIKENKNNNNNNNQNYYSKINMMPYKGVIFPTPLYNKGEVYYPKYYSGYIYFPVQNQYMKNTQDKKIGKEENNTNINSEINKINEEKGKNTHNEKNEDNTNNNSNKEEDKKI